MAKQLSKQPFQSVNHTTIKPYPKASVLILLMLMMCGDTGTLLNPGPIRRNIVDKCGICEYNTKTNDRVLSCKECDTKVHKRCGKIILTNSYICNICSFRFLPFVNIFDVDFNNIINCARSNNRTHNVDISNNFNAERFECFKKKGLHILHANARSIFHKLPELNLIAKESNAAIIAITETWLDVTYTDASVNIEGYNLVRRDREGHAGGVCAYIREDLAFNNRSDLNNLDLEDLWLGILLPKSKPLYIGVCCRTDDNKKCLDCLENTLSKLRFDYDLIVFRRF